MYFHRKTVILILVGLLFIFVCCSNLYSLQEGASTKNCFDVKKHKAYDKDGKTMKICNSKTNLYANLNDCNNNLFSKVTYKCDNAYYYGGYGNGSGNGTPSTNRKSGVQWV